MFKIKPINILYVIMYSIPNALFSFGILYIINNVVSGNSDFLKDYMGLVFVAIIIYTYLLNIVFQKRLNKYTFEILYENEKNVFDKILKTPLITLEKQGPQRFYTAVEDLRFFSLLPDTVTHTINSLLYLLLCVVYLFTLSLYSALTIVALIVVIAGFYFFIMNTMSAQVQKLRLYNESYYKFVHDVMNGFKEFKMSVQRRSKLMNHYLNPNRENAKILDFNINFTFISINLISQYGLYFVIGIVLFLLPEIGLLAREDVVSYVVILLFISGPVNTLINLQNTYTRFMVANSRVKRFMDDFEDDDGAKFIAQEETKEAFEAIEFKDIHFEYETKEDSTEKPFGIGPINLSVKKGETIFIIGGNGSGKSTFLNILTGLYKPSKGQIFLNDKAEVSIDENMQNKISAVFTSDYILSHNFDDYALENNEEYIELLKTMELEKIVPDSKESSARRWFSKGQTKRMLMIFALLEKKPILVLDEWAADQDPHFRKYFYEELIPRLKAEGKTIIAVTHDDTYFKHADRIIKFDYGKIVKDFNVKEEQLLETENLWM